MTIAMTSLGLSQLGSVALEMVDVKELISCLSLQELSDPFCSVWPHGVRC
jgi:hypothetical protein